MNTRTGYRFKLPIGNPCLMFGSNPSWQGLKVENLPEGHTGHQVYIREDDWVYVHVTMQDGSVRSFLPDLNVGKGEPDTLRLVFEKFDNPEGTEYVGVTDHPSLR